MSLSGRLAPRAGGILTALLISLIPAHAAGMVALVATGRPAAVLVSFGLAYLLFAAFAARHIPSHDRLDHPAAPAEPAGRILAWLLLAAGSAIAVLITYPRIGRLGRLIVGNTGDSGLNIYLLEWQLHAAAHDPGSYLHPNIFQPERFTLFWGPSLIPLAPVYGLARLATGSLIAGFNLTMILISLATMAAGYLFLRKAGFSQMLAAAGAVLYATTGQRIAHLGHLDSFQTLWIPVFGIFLLRIWEKNRVLDGALLGLALGLTLSSAPYYFLSGLAMLGAMVVLSLPRYRTLPWRGVLGAGAATLLLAGPVLVMSNLAHLSRAADEVFPVSWADIYHPGYYVNAVHWLAQAAGDAGGGRTLENWLFPSVALSILAICGAVAWVRRSTEGRCPLPASHPPALPRLLAACTVSGLVMAAGPHLVLGSHRIPLPMAAIMKLPGFESARVTGRFIAPAFLALTVVALIGLDWIASRLRGKGKVLVAAAAVAATLLTTQAAYPAVALDVNRPAAVNRALAKQPEGLVAELPWSGCPGLDCLFTEPPRMIWSRYDWFPRLGGYSGHIPPYWPEAQGALANFPDERSMKFLDDFGVRYVILRVSSGKEGSHFDTADAARIAEAAERSGAFRSVRRYGRDYLIALR